MGQTLNHQGTAGFSPCFHLPGSLWAPILTHSLLAVAFLGKDLQDKGVV